MPPTSDADDILTTFKETPNQPFCATNNTGATPCEDFFTFDFSSFATVIITDNGQVDVQMAITKIPEPATLMLLGTSLIAFGVAVTKRRQGRI